MLGTPKPKKEQIAQSGSVGNIPCAAISVLCKSFIESIALYSVKTNKTLESYMKVLAPKEGVLEVELVAPKSDLLEVHRFAIEQMLIIGVQAVAKEYPNDIQLTIGK